MAEWIDTHAHTAFEAFDEDRAEVYARARAAGVVAIVEVGVGLEGSKAAVALAARETMVHAAVGLHPAYPDGFDRDWAEFEALVRTTDVAAIGECGLDYHWMKAPKEAQQRAFRAQIGLARQMALPYIVHCRDAEEDLLDLLLEEGYPRGVVHCFSGTRDQAARLVAAGMRLSFCGNVSYPRNSALREAVHAVPLDRLLLETDAPFLPPQGRRGGRNEPAFVVETATLLAGIYGVTPEELARRTTANARRFFDLKPEGSPGTIAYRIGNNLYINLTRLCTAHCY
ncbi:MAG: TatD family hydrolase, partial [Planctomycetaceae bacterium]